MPGIRASDEEREQVVEKLSEHTTTGRLTLAELEERIGLAYKAKFRDELVKLTADLPDTAGPAATRPVGADGLAPRSSTRKTTRTMFAIMGGSEKRGRWRVGKKLTSVAVMGGHTIDLRSAELESDDTTIVVVCVMGGTDVYVPDSIDLEVGGFSLMGGSSERGSSRQSRPGAPRIRLLMYNVMGGSDVWRLPEETQGLSLKEARKIAKHM